MVWGSTVPYKEWGSVPEGLGARASLERAASSNAENGMIGQQVRDFLGRLTGPVFLGKLSSLQPSWRIVIVVS